MGVEERKSDSDTVEAAPTDDLQDDKKHKYPKSVFFIVSNEFCERFSYYGMRTILILYFTDMFNYSDADAKIIYHTFVMLVYFFPVFGAMLADSWLGKFRTIFYLSIVYACGNVILALAATKPIGMPQIEFSMVGLFLVALGTGGIKPCVAAFGGDQFTLPQQAKQLAAFFSIFYFSINSGSFVSTFITPILRDQECFGSQYCFTLAFGIPGVLMVVSIIIFGLGKSMYKIKEPEGNMVIQVSKCIGNAISQKSKSSEKKEHWLDYAKASYGDSFVEDIKATLRVLVLYIPLPVFWCLFDQQGTGWTLQARRMDGELGFYTILPDQMQVVNPILILIFIPLFDVAIYPLLTKLHILKTPLQRLVTGGMLAGVAFLISAGIYIAIEAENPILPEAGSGHITYYNFEGDIRLINSQNNFNVTIPKMGYSLLELDQVNGNKKVTFDIEYLNENNNKKVDLTFVEKETIGFYKDMEKTGIYTTFKDSRGKEGHGLPLVRVILNVPDADKYKVSLVMDETIEKVENLTNTISLRRPGEYTIKFDGPIKYISIKYHLKLGGVYTVLAQEDPGVNNKLIVNTVTITEPNSVHMLWIIPQYVVLTAAEIMFSITGLEFSYSQAPVSMKAVMQASWLLTTAFGNLLVVIIEAVEPFQEQSNNFFLYAGLMFVDMIVFAFMAMKYKYVKPVGKEDEVKGIENEGFGSNNEKNSL